MAKAATKKAPLASKVNPAASEPAEDKPAPVERNVIQPASEPEVKDITREEFDEVVDQVRQTRQLAHEFNDRRQPYSEVRKQTAEMVASFRNQRIPGEYPYLAWDDKYSEESRAVVYHSDVPYTAPMAKVLEEYNSRFKRSLTEGRDHMKFKPTPS